MKIQRNGQEYELTFSELSKAHDEYLLNHAFMDICEIYETSTDLDIELSDKQLKSIAEKTLHNLFKNEDYYEAYWKSLRHTFKENIQELLSEKKSLDEVIAECDKRSSRQASKEKNVLVIDIDNER